MTDTTSPTTPTAAIGNWLDAPTPILLWKVKKAPLKHLVGLLQGVSDEVYDDDDWVALIPKYLHQHPKPWRVVLDDPWVWEYRESDCDLRQSHQAVKIWPWSHAPDEYRALSSHGGDEDWVALTPSGMSFVPLLHAGTRFAPCRVSKHRLRYGRAVYIGAHS